MQSLTKDVTMQMIGNMSAEENADGAGGETILVVNNWTAII
jgi:hypothetical protein